MGNRHGHVQVHRDVPHPLRRLIRRSGAASFSPELETVRPKQRAQVAPDRPDHPASARTRSRADGGSPGGQGPPRPSIGRLAKPRELALGLIGIDVSPPRTLDAIAHLGQAAARCSSLSATCEYPTISPRQVRVRNSRFYGHEFGRQPFTDSSKYQSPVRLSPEGDSSSRDRDSSHARTEAKRRRRGTVPAFTATEPLGTDVLPERGARSDRCIAVQGIASEIETTSPPPSAGHASTMSASDRQSSAIRSSRSENHSASRGSEKLVDGRDAHVMLGEHLRHRVELSREGIRNHASNPQCVPCLPDEDVQGGDAKKRQESDFD